MSEQVTIPPKVDPRVLRARAAEDCPALHDVPGMCDCSACLLRDAADEIDRLQAEKETLSRELSVYMEAVTKLENAIHGL